MYVFLFCELYVIYIFYIISAKKVLEYKNENDCLYFLACAQGSVMSCEYLLLNGARINCQDAEGKTPLHLATELGIH